MIRKAKPVYHDLVIVATSRTTDIWLADDGGHLVQKEIGTLRTSLLPGYYTVEFGLGNPATQSVWQKRAGTRRPTWLRGRLALALRSGCCQNDEGRRPRRKRDQAIEPPQPVRKAALASARAGAAAKLALDAQSAAD